MSTGTGNEWRLSVFGLATAWWLALAPWICGWLWRAWFSVPLAEASREAVAVGCVLLWVACFGLSLDNLGARDAAWARALARWFLVGASTLPLIALASYFLAFLAR